MRNGRRVIRQDHCNFDACEREHYLILDIASCTTAGRKGAIWMRLLSLVRLMANDIRLCHGRIPTGTGICASAWIDGSGKMVHRVIMEEALGRDCCRLKTSTTSTELRDDNRLENFELWTSAQPGGQRVVDKVAWAREMLDLYGALYPVGTKSRCSVRRLKGQ